MLLFVGLFCFVHRLAVDAFFFLFLPQTGFLCVALGCPGTKAGRSCLNLAEVTN